MGEHLEHLSAGMAIPFGGDRLARVGEELASAFRPGDHLVVVQTTGDLLHVPAQDWEVAQEAVTRAYQAFGAMGDVDDDQVDSFYRGFAARLRDDSTFAPIAQANAADMAAAAHRGRSTTRLELTEEMRSDMAAGLEGWLGRREPHRPVETIRHDGWRVELWRAGLGVVGFVFEGRPNVFADATGVLRMGNTVVMRIGSDALGTARAIVINALDPALAESGLPPGAVTLVDSAHRAAAWAMLSDRRLALAVARGSGPAVNQLGAVARQAGIPVSLHGTGGAWIVAGPSADPAALEAAVFHSLDRKVCNTLNTACVVEPAAPHLVPVILAALARAGERRGAEPRLHVVGDLPLPEGWEADRIDVADVGREWEWEESPEMTLLVVESIGEAVDLFNAHSPRFIASLISEDPAELERFYATVDSPFVGNGFTRWVDGQYALGRPELGLSNWQAGRLLGRGGVLSGDSVHTLRTRAIQSDPDVSR